MSRTALWLTELAELVYPEKHIHVFNNDPDSRVLEWAIAGKAKAILTGDKAMLAIEISHGVRILSLAAYLNQ